VPEPGGPQSPAAGLRQTSGPWSTRKSAEPRRQAPRGLTQANLRGVPPTLLDEARPTLLALTLLSSAPTSQLGVSAGPGGAHISGRPAGPSRTPAERYALEISGALTMREGRRWLSRARAELQEARRRPLALIDCDTLADLEGRIVTEGAGMRPLEVAIACRCTTTMVRRARLSAGCDPERGGQLGDATPREWAAQLRSAGFSLRQTAALTGVPRSTLSDQERQPVAP
jgi:hypothetical protein